MVTILIKKYDALGNTGYYPVMRDEVTEDMRDQLLAFFKGKPPVEGFYQYIIPQKIGDPQQGYTINPDVINYLSKATKQNGRTNTSAGKEDQNTGL